MTSEIRTNSLKSRAGLSTVTMTDSGPMFSGITTFVDNSGFTFGVGGGTSIFTPATNVLTFGTNNTEKIRIDASGHMHGVGVITATHFYGDGSNLTGISAGTSLSGSTNNTVCTVTGANAIQGEANLTFDGNDLTITGTAPCVNLTDTDSDDYKISNTQGVLAIRDTTAGADRFVINDNGTGYFLSNFQIGSTTSSPGATLHVKTSYPSLKVDSGGHASDAYVRIISGNAQNSRVDFGDSDDDDIGMIDYDHANNSMRFLTSTGERLKIDSTGRMTQNGTTSADTASALTLKNGQSGNDHTILELISDPNQMSAIYFGASDDRYQGQIRYKDNDHYMSFYTDQAEKVRIHSTGQVSISHHNYIAESHDAMLVVKPNITDSSKDSIGILVDGDSGTGGGQSSPSMGIKIVNTNTWNNSTHQYGLYNEVGQQYVASGTGIFNKVSGLYGTTTGYHIELNKNNNAYTNGYGLTMNIKPTGSGGTNYFIYCQKDDTNLKMRVLQNGNLQNANNSYGSTSDVKLKENIVDANSQWDDIKSLRVRNFNFKDDPDKVKMLGVVAQEAEAVSAGLVETDNDIEIDETTGEGKIVGTTKFVKYSILYMKAVKCLQEAQTRIEKLEQENIALRVRVTNLEDN